MYTKIFYTLQHFCHSQYFSHTKIRIFSNISLNKILVLTEILTKPNPEVNTVITFEIREFGSMENGITARILPPVSQMAVSTHILE